MSSDQPRRSNGIFPEVFLAIAIVVLFVQLYPPLMNWIIGVFDVRNWTRRGWFVANVAFVLAVLFIRMQPGSLATLRRKRCERRATKSQQLEEKSRQCEELKKKRELEEQREILARLAAGRKRRIY